MDDLLWIKAKICETLMGWKEIHYSQMVAEFDSSCRKDVVEVLAQMYDEGHIWSTGGEISWVPPEKQARSMPMKIEDLREMIAKYAGVKWDTSDG